MLLRGSKRAARKMNYTYEKPTGVNWGTAKAAFIVGWRADQVPKPIKQPIFKRACEHCGHETVTEKEYPNDIPIVCNICAKDIAAQLTKEHAAKLIMELPADA